MGASAHWYDDAWDPARDLTRPFRWKKPRRISVRASLDLFAGSVSNEWIAAVFGVMAACPRHTFQLCTKHPPRMRAWFEWIADRARSNDEAIGNTLLRQWMSLLAAGAVAMKERDFGIDARGRVADSVWPLPNFWAGVSVENQAAADEHIPDLLATPAAVRFVRCVPLLGPVNLRRVRPNPMPIDALTGSWGVDSNNDAHYKQDPRIGWVLAGCASGVGARPVDVAWFRSLRDQCKAASVPFWLKRAVLGGGTLVDFFTNAVTLPGIWQGPGSKRKSGGAVELPYLDGVQHVEFPEVHCEI